jgi:hypothetical protein
MIEEEPPSKFSICRKMEKNGCNGTSIGLRSEWSGFASISENGKKISFGAIKGDSLAKRSYIHHELIIFQRCFSKLEGYARILFQTRCDREEIECHILSHLCAPIPQISNFANTWGFPLQF